MKKKKKEVKKEKKKRKEQRTKKNKKKNQIIWKLKNQLRKFSYIWNSLQARELIFNNVTSV